MDDKREDKYMVPKIKKKNDVDMEVFKEINPVEKRKAKEE
jgi:hypothetical protein